MRGDPQNNGPSYAAADARRVVRALRGGHMAGGDRWGSGERMALPPLASDCAEGRLS